MIDRREFLKQTGFSLASFGLANVLASRALAQALPTVRVVYSAPGLAYAGLFVATLGGTWAKNRITADIKQVQGGPLAMTALVKREADAAGVSGVDPLIAWDKGIKTLAVAAFQGSLSMQIIASNEWLAKAGISPKSPLENKIKATKAARIGASTIGGGPAQYTRYLARTAGLDPQVDTRIMAVGFTAARMAALKTNQVDMIVASPPEGDQVELEGFGQIFINCATEVPTFRDFAYIVLSVSPEFAEKQPDLTRRAAMSIGNANDLINNNFGQALDMLRKELSSFDPKVVERALEREKSTYPRGGRMTEAMWRNLIKVSQEAKLVGGSLPAEEGALWTNKFLG